MQSILLVIGSLALAKAEDLNMTAILDKFIELYPVQSWIEHGFFDYGYLKIINPHWLKFPPRYDWQHYGLAAVYVVIMICGVGGNSMVIFMYARKRHLRTPSNILVLNLACSDLLMMTELPMFIYNSVYLGPALGDKACRIYGFLGGLSGTCSICLLATISLNRYLVIKQPLKGNFTSLQAKLYATACWIYSSIFSVTPALDIGLGSYTPEGYLTSCSFDYLTQSLGARIFIFIFFIAAWVLPIVTITFAYRKIIYIVLIGRYDQTSTSLSTEFRTHMKPGKKHKQEVQLAFVVLLIIIVWFAAWTPYAIISLLGIFGFQNLIGPTFSMLPALFAKTASCINPFVYALTNPKFKSEVSATFGLRKKNFVTSSRFSYSVQYSNRRSTVRTIDRTPMETEDSAVIEFIPLAVSNNGKIKYNSDN